MQEKLVVIGGGAAGFFCAVNAARMNPHLEVTIVEKTSKLLSKVKVSGGGRCNVTHACFDIHEMARRYPRGGNFVKKAFHQFFTTDTVNWFEERGVTLKTEKDGRMFPVSDSSQTVIDCLVREANKYKVEIMMNREVKALTWENGKFTLHTTDTRPLVADFLCVACGGYPKTSMFDWLKETGHTMEAPVPSLFTFNLPQHPLGELMGVSVEKAKVKIMTTRLEQEGALLITHWGFSGPAILRLSAWGARELAACNWNFRIMINWLPDHTEQTLRESFIQQRTAQAAQKITGKNEYGLPKRLWEFLAGQSGVSDTMRWADLPAAVQNRFVKNLVSYECEVKGKTTFKEEFVTAGGIKLSEVDPNTMMSKKIPRLFFAGEILDVDGITGGYNFQHAWTSGWVAAKAITALAIKTA
ncbi:MAG: NAD(P)/FAD-dependent oxidoreductase [Chitinophagaceae bacterium]